MLLSQDQKYVVLTVAANADNSHRYYSRLRCQIRVRVAPPDLAVTNDMCGSGSWPALRTEVLRSCNNVGLGSWK